MARETKVGLLAGLAFIICFAVILANRGGEESLSGRDLPLQISLNSVNRTGDGSRSVPALGAKNSGEVHGSLPYPNGPNPSVLERGTEAPSHGGQAPLAASGRNAGGPHSTAEERSPSAVGLVRLDAPPVNADATLSAALSGQTQRNGPFQTTLEPRAAETSGKNGNVQRLTPPGVHGMETGTVPQQSGVPTLIPASAIPSRTYEVVAGDTLSKIAGAQYGSKSAALVNAIFDANRSVLTGPDTLPSGISLVIPNMRSDPATIAGAPPQTPAEASKAEVKRKGPGNPAETAKNLSGKPSLPPSLPIPMSHRDNGREGVIRIGSKSKEPSGKSDASRWYQVKKGDRYFSIARELLGDGGRWREIHELNKDRFTDPGMIREGVRIKLPEGLALNSSDRRR